MSSAASDLASFATVPQCGSYLLLREAWSPIRVEMMISIDLETG